MGIKLDAVEGQDFSTFKNGDRVKMNDGSSAYFCCNLSELDIMGWPIAEYQNFLIGDPYYIFKQNGGLHGLDTPINVYGTRDVFNPEFGYVRQALIDYLGSPSWINLPVGAALERFLPKNEPELSA